MQDLVKDVPFGCPTLGHVLRTRVLAFIRTVRNSCYTNLRLRATAF
jgi:hypothetical protein